ncbi:hypothetical protein C0J52_01267 [Blattella germanica]|nr:hypothetical protein C0J52_01267 [Blattella germanica]
MASLFPCFRQYRCARDKGRSRLSISCVVNDKGKPLTIVSVCVLSGWCILQQKVEIDIDSFTELLPYHQIVSSSPSNRYPYHQRNGRKWETRRRSILSSKHRSASASLQGALDSAPFVTIPRGDIILEYGNPFRLRCILNTNHSEAIGKNVSDIHIFRDDKEVQPEFLRIINSTTLEVFMEEPPISSSMYYCKLKDKESYTALCLNRVVIERKPQEVQNFSCISRNWQNLTCTWKKPPSYVDTTYDLAFRLPGRAGGRMHYKCPQIVQNETDGMCYWDIKTDPHYRLPYEYYYFTLTGKNVFGNWSKQIKFHHYSHVLPAPPTDLMIVNTTTNSTFLKWKVPFPMQLFPPGILHKIEYQSQWDSMSTWLVANTSFLPLHSENHTYNLSGLKYANSLYDVRVYMRSPAAVGEDKWSQPTRNTFKTKPTIPGAAPKVDIGSFEVSGGLPNRDVYIYWQHIPDYLKNADNFEYKVISVEESGEPRHLIPDETTNAYAKFRGISFNSFKFQIVSANEIGFSSETSTVYVPSKTESE